MIVAKKKLNKNNYFMQLWSKQIQKILQNSDFQAFCFLFNILVIFPQKYDFVT